MVGTFEYGFVIKALYELMKQKETKNFIIFLLLFYFLLSFLSLYFSSSFFLIFLFFSYFFVIFLLLSTFAT
jgi:hypothetical protein